MEKLSVNLARSLWFCHITDLNPKGLNLFPIVTPFLVNTYKFKKYPAENDLIDLSKGITYEAGEFVTNDGPVLIRFTVYNDGIVADSISSTKDSDAFLADMLTRLSKDVGLPNYEEIIKTRGYLSQLYVKMQKSLEDINSKLRKISKVLSDKVLDGSHHYEVGGISFWSDQVHAMKPSPFTFERVVNVPFSENRYYSASPLQTEDHWELLIMMESILSK